MFPQKRQWCRRSSNEKFARQRVQAVAELSGTQAGLLELAFTLATILACTRSGHQRRTAARQTLVFVHEVPCQRIYLFPYNLNQQMCSIVTFCSDLTHTSPALLLAPLLSHTIPFPRVH